MQPFLAMITPVSSAGPVDPGYGVGAPGTPPPAQPGAPDQTLPGNLPKPEHPIYYPLPPGAPVDPSYGVPIEHPEHPIAKPPAQPGTPTHPIATPPGEPTHPIVLPPDQGGGWGPIYIWGGGPGARPPIALPPEGQPPAPEAKVQWKAIWTPANGWQTIGVVVPSAPIATPSKK